MSVLRLKALDKLQECIEEAIPELVGRICAGPSEANHRLTFPSLSITPISFKYQPNQAKPHHNATHSTVIMEVGKHEADVQLRVGASTHRERVILEDKILQLFLEQELAPGILVTPIADCWDAHVVWELEDEEWEDEKAFDSKWYTTISITGQIPALVTRKDAYTIEQLQLGLIEDFTTTLNSSTINTTAGVEVVQINQDGSIGPVT